MLEEKIYKAEETVKEVLSKAKRNDKALKAIDIARQKDVYCHNSNLILIYKCNKEVRYLTFIHCCQLRALL